MLPRTRNEKILLAVLVAILFVGGNYFGYSWLAARQSKLKQDDVRLHADQVAAQVALQETDQWQQRKAWINNSQPPMPNNDEGAAKAEVLDFVLKGARKNKLEVVEQSLNDTQKGAAGSKVIVSVKVKGSMMDLCKWLTDLEKPDQFYAVPLFSLKADQDQKSMLCTLQVARYYKGTTP